MTDQPEKPRAFQIQQQGFDLVDKLLSAANPKAIYGEPVAHENYLVMTASELMVSAGYGYGGGDYVLETKDDQAKEAAASGEAKGDKVSYGGGGGGGGYTMGRPVAVIIMGDSVSATPVVDWTKIGIAMFTALGAMAIALGRMSSARRKMS